MDIDNFTSNGFVRRWQIIDARRFPAFAEFEGQARCPEDATSTLALQLPALQRNDATRQLVNAVEALEAAQRIVAAGPPDNGQPKFIPDPQWIDPEDGSAASLVANPDWALLPQTIVGEDQDGQPVATPEPRWVAYNTAVAYVQASPAVINAFAIWRAAAPIPEDAPEDDLARDARAAVMAEFDRLAVIPLAHDPRPVPEEISRRQFGFACAVKDFMTQDEALGFVNTGTLPAIVNAVIATLPADQQFAAKMALASNSFHRHNPATMMFLPLLQIQSKDADDVWRIGAAMP